MSAKSTSKTNQTFSPTDLGERATHRRAVEAVIWGIPAVNYDLMFQSMMRDAKGAVNQILYWSWLADWKNQYLTPNPDTIYFMRGMFRSGPLPRNRKSFRVVDSADDSSAKVMTVLRGCFDRITTSA
jgi:hypothetical protein